MTAKSSLRELRKHISALFPSHNHSQHQHQHPSSSSSSSSSSRATLYLPTKPVFSAAERAQVSAWRAYLKWEDGNPMVIDDKAVLFARMQGIYRKAVVRMRYFSQIWWVFFLVSYFYFYYFVFIYLLIVFCFCFILLYWWTYG